MKNWFITLTLLCAAGFAHADSKPSAPDAAAAASAAAQKQPQTQKKVTTRKARRLPHGDLRYCLDLKTNEEIIRCAETPLKK